MISNYNSVEEFRHELNRREAAKADYLPDTRQLSFKEGGRVLEVEGVGQYGVHNHFHGQTADLYSIPRTYYNRIRQDYPDVLDYTVNAHFAKIQKTPEKRLIRTLDGVARANLSRKYNWIYDNKFVVNSALPVIVDRDDFELRCCRLDDYRVVLQFVFNKFQAEIKGSARKGDIVRWGVTLTNSEVGVATWDISKWLEFIWCTNGASRQSIVNRRHVGKSVESIDDYSEETIKAESKALQLKVRDNLKAALTYESFNEEVAKLQASLGDKVDKPEAFVKNVTKKFEGVLNQADEDDILATLVNEGNLNRYGLIQAVTALAKRDDIDTEKATAYEKLGGDIIELKPDAWAVLNDPKAFEAEVKKSA